MQHLLTTESLAQEAEAERRSSEALAEFFASVEAHLLLVQSDPLSTELRKDQRALMIAAFLLLLVSLGTVSIKEIASFESFNGKLEVAFAGASVLLGTVICLYLEIVFLVRGYAEHVAHGIRVASSRTRLTALSEYLGHETNEYKGRKPFDESSEGIAAARRHRFSVSPEGQRERIRRGMLEDDRAAADAQFREASQRYRENVFEPYAKAQWLQHQLYLVTRTQKLRFVIESVFPIFFGAVALAVAAWRLLGDG